MVKYSSVDTKYSIEAKKLEKKGREYKVGESIKYSPKATESFESAGDYWVKDGNHRVRTGEEFRNSLSYAVSDYNFAIKSINGKEEREIKRIERKIRSVETKLENSSKKRNHGEVSERGLVLRTMNSEIALPVLSIASFSIALTFSSFNITGFVVGEGVVTPIGYIAIGCFIFGLIFAGIYFKHRINEKKKFSKKKTVSKKKKIISKRNVVKKKK